MYGEMCFYVNPEKGTVTAVLEDYGFKVLDRYILNYGSNKMLSAVLYGMENEDCVSLVEKLGFSNLLEPIKATARCHEDDEFDFEIGKQVAIAKLRVKYYQKIKSVLDKLIDTMNKEMLYVLDQAFDENNMLTMSMDELDKVKE